MYGCYGGVKMACENADDGNALPFNFMVGFASRCVPTVILGPYVVIPAAGMTMSKYLIEAKKNRLQEVEAKKNQVVENYEKRLQEVEKKYDGLYTWAADTSTKLSNESNLRVNYPKPVKC